MLLGEALLRTDPDAARAELERARITCRRSGQVAWELAARARLALALVWQGRHVEASAIARELAVAIDEDARIGPAVLLRLVEMTALAAAGRLEDALAVAERAEAHASRFELPVDGDHRADPRAAV